MTAQVDAGHGHVNPRRDGAKARCGGPALCSTCAAEQVEKDRDDLANRLGIVRLNQQELMRFFGLPKGYEFVSLYADPECRSINTVVRSADLLPVAPGVAAPDVAGLWTKEIYIDPDEPGRPWMRFNWTPT